MKALYQFKELLAKRGITDLAHVAIELLRVHLTKEACAGIAEVEPYQRYALMQEETGGRLGYFQGEPTWFEELYQVGEQVDLLAGLARLFQHDRTGVMACESALTDYLLEQILPPQFETVLVAEAHKLLPSLIDWRQVCLDKEMVLTAQEKWQAELLRFLFRDDERVRVHHLSIYYSLELEQDFDYILSIPSFGLKLEVDSDRYFTRESEGIAVQNLLDFLSPQGEMSVIVPSRFTFSGTGFRRLREWILQHAFLSRIVRLPEGLLKPHKGIQSYLLTLSKPEGEDITVAQMALTPENRLAVAEERQIAPGVLRGREDWRFDVLFGQFGVERLTATADANCRVAKLSEVAELFRGRSISKQLLQPGEVHVLNISNITEGEIGWEGLDTIDEPRRKVKRYELEEGDVVITCRGTVIKVGIIRELPYYTIASANLIVIRVTDDRVNSEYVKIFLESPVGLRLVQTFQRGSKVMNIHPDDLGELTIPLPPPEKQAQLVKKYRQEQLLFIEAQARWQRMRQTIYDHLI
jgi:Type I restriction modification DNA specificity domain/N-6 DNA Methylase